MSKCIVCFINFPIGRLGRKQPVLPPSNYSATQPTQEHATPTMQVLTSRNDEVKYAQPGAMCQPPLIPQEVSPPSVSSQYQGPQSKWSGHDISLQFTPSTKV